MVGKLKRYTRDEDQNPLNWGSSAGHWLSGQAKKVWDCGLTELEDEKETPRWEFRATTKTFYGTTTPAMDHRIEYANCI